MTSGNQYEIDQEKAEAVKRTSERHQDDERRILDAVLESKNSPSTKGLDKIGRRQLVVLGFAVLLMLTLLAVLI
jgi:hypothetical protein